MSESAHLTGHYPSPVADSHSPGSLSFASSAASSAFAPASSLAFPSLDTSIPRLARRHPSVATRFAARLVLADGTAIEGKGIGAAGVVVGELVFQTSMVGYQEAMTDPSYGGQLLIFTYPLVGNYGAADSANESARIHARAVILREAMPNGGHREAVADLDQMLRQQGVPGMTGVDTRHLTRVVRTHGVLPAALACGPAEELPSVEELRELALALDYDGTDFVAACSTPEIIWHPPARPGGPRIALLDYGAKQSMLSRLRERGAGVWQVPARLGAEQILALRPDAVLLSNGPGDPLRLEYAVQTLRGLLSVPELPIFGICLGNQLLALAAGGKTAKMRFGHRGVNQPVLEKATGRLYVTTQNHGYVVDAESLPPDFRVTHTNLNDGSVEGIAHVSRPVRAVQWHPEAGPGPSDSVEMIDGFVAAAEVAHAS